MLDANPVVAGITYLEGDSGSDDSPDYFEVSFQGGSATTTMTQFVVSGDQDHSGTLNDGDMFFDVSASSPGTGAFHPFQFNAARSLGVSASDIVSFDVSSNGLQLTVNVRNFVAGDRLAFSLDVDEIERDRVDKIASGVEFERSLFHATFQDAHYTFQPRDIAVQHLLEGGVNQLQHSGIFYDEYDQLFARGNELAGATLQLYSDAGQQAPNRSDGAVDVYNLIPKPVTISGQVYHDKDLDCLRDANEQGIAGVQIALQKFNTQTGQYEQIATTTTDANGQYRFGTDLNIHPGKFRLVETQPSGYLNVGAMPGTVEGMASGEVAMLAGQPNVLSEVVIPLGNNAAVNYDFCEVRPASISGHVWHDRNNDGIMDSGENRIVNVLVKITRIGSEPGQDDPFASTAPIFASTDGNGFYQATGLPPGVYEVVEVNTYPPGSNPLAGYIDGKDSLGTVNGTTNGTLTNDQFNQITLRPENAGVQYNFGELKPVSIDGFVSVTNPEGECIAPGQPGYRPIAGVTIQLFNASGEMIASTLTNVNGRFFFENLAPGTYSIVEVQPAGYLDGHDEAGTVNSVATGNSAVNDRISQIVLQSGDAGVNYEFCEHEPASLCGHVWHDRDDDGIRDSGEEGIADVRIELFDAQGVKIAEVRTDATGEYCFEDLYAGVYKIVETQPADYADGKDSLGDVEGVVAGQKFNDQFRSIELKFGEHGDNYDFGEFKLGRISGFVRTDNNGNCVLDTSQGEIPLRAVTMQLVNGQGQVIGTTTTDATGFYKFEQLLPGTYSVRQVQPNGYFTIDQNVGVTESGAPGTGDASVVNKITGIQVGSGAALSQYNFCEQAPAKIQGRVWEDGPVFSTDTGVLPANYRFLRDGIYQAGSDHPIAGVRMTLWYYNDIEGGSLNPRPVTLADVLPGFYPHLSGQPANTPIYLLTDGSGAYSFAGLKAGNYIVLQAHPTGFSDANDRPGTTTGFTFNSEVEVLLAPTILTETFTTQQLLDAVNGIQVSAGGISSQNNFTEVRVIESPDIPHLPPPPPTPPQNPPLPPLPPSGLGWFLAGAQFLSEFEIAGTGVVTGIDANPAPEFTWHLSVVNSGDPRGDGQVAQARESVWMNASFSDDSQWNRTDMDQSAWSFSSLDGDRYALKADGIRFGMLDGFPLAGDWNGDGIDEVGVFWNGFWFIDVDGNRMWDRNDLVAKLGNGDDQAVVGDWDGDGKDDIGIFGPIWPNDEKAIDEDPGLPNPANRMTIRPKNTPPRLEDATEGARIMRLTSAGKSRADLIDHVFRYGNAADIAIAGDWNGSGIRGIGIFRDGSWKLDTNGNGRGDSEDTQFVFGGKGDLPVIGDFNGDGIDEVGVFHEGTWTIDTNNNRELDAQDLVFQLGDADDLPVVGDFDGDGRDEPVLYHRSAQPRVAGL